MRNDGSSLRRQAFRLLRRILVPLRLASCDAGGTERVGGLDLVRTAFSPAKSRFGSPVSLRSFWDNHTSPAVWIAVTGFVAVLINFGGSRVYGETEFWFASIKMVTILGLIILGIVLTAGGGPSGEVIGGKYWQNPGPFVQYLGIAGAKGRFLGFFTVLLQSAYSYSA